jgi:hypothetical protein
VSGQYDVIGRMTNESFIVRVPPDASTVYNVHLLTYILCGLSTQANYTDRATAACRRISANFCHVVSVTDPYCRILGSYR